jgi:hypothetical protein
MKLNFGPFLESKSHNDKLKTSCVENMLQTHDALLYYFTRPISEADFAISNWFNKKHDIQKRINLLRHQPLKLDVLRSL